tara:strand:- start:4007 stop:5152 length:1146 start_codon:yes stop_codon:yes gene_type:complete
MTNADLKVGQAKMTLLIHHPFFGSIAGGLNFVETDNVKTMATDGRSIFWNRAFVDSLDKDHVMGVIAHEVMHVALKHMLRMEKRNHKKWNICTDIAINDILIDSGFSIPEQGLFSTSKPEWNKFKGWAAEKIYAEMPDDDVPEDGPAWGEVIPMQGEDGGEMSEAEAQQAEADIEIKVIMAADAAKSCGKLPSSIDEIVQVMRRPQVDWRDVLNRFIGGDQPDDYTWRRPQKNAWFNQGVYLPSVDRMGAGDIIILGDSSRSVSDEEWFHFLGEINNISEDHKPNSITVITFDHKVRTVKRYEQGEIIEKVGLGGRGGTRVTPAFDYVEENQLPCDNMVVLTDLEISDFPDRPDYPVLWVSTDIGSDKAPWGEVAILKMGD